MKFILGEFISDLLEHFIANVIGDFINILDVFVTNLSGAFFAIWFLPISISLMDQN